jgi:glycine cleavage system T protein (aminomethyltransferase)
MSRTDVSSGLWRVVSPQEGVPTEGERRHNKRLISQVTGQMGGICALAVCRFFCFGGPVGRRTPLFELHQELGARIVDFGGWDMPVQYSSQIGEHHAVRRAAGIFDVSHMCVVDLKGTRVRAFLQHLLANDVGKLKTPGKALYSCMLNETGGVLDDLIVYFLDESAFRVVVNAGTRDKDLAWIRSVARPFEIDIRERADLAMLAVQGPEARTKVAALLSQSGAPAAMALKPFFGQQIDEWFVARTGYTGEDGFEVMLPSSEAVRVWRQLNAAGVTSCGLGARDTLRLEAGMNLYGNDMDESTHPFESGLAWTVAMQPSERHFIGREALEKALTAPTRQLVGLVLEDRGVLRSHQKVVIPDGGTGEITSGTFSPTLERSIAFARVPAGALQQVQVDIRGKLLNARVVKPPFVRFGKPMI